MLKLRDYASHVALVGVASLIIGLALLLIGDELAIQNEIPLALGVILLAISVLLNPGQARQMLTGRQARYGGNAVLLSITFLAILGMVNFLSSRHHKRFDLTAEKQFSLSPQTIQVVKGLSAPVKITSFMRGGFNQQLEDLMTEYKYYSDMIEFEAIDPDMKPSVAREYAISSYDTIVYESEGRRQDGFGTEEQDVTTSLIKVTDAEPKAVYFLTGHGERSIDDFGQEGLGYLKQALERDSYQVRSLNLAITDTIPSDIVALVIARPTQRLLDHERNTILRYLMGAGKGLIVQDPGLPEDLSEILTAYRVKLNGDVIIEPNSSLLGDPGSPVVQRYPYSIITQDLPMTIYPQAQSIQIIDDVDTPGFSASPLVQTTSSSWGETDFTNPAVRYDADQDNPGPLNIGVTVESPAPLMPDEAATKTSTNSRLVVFGDSDFLGNAFISSPGNQDLALNAINWLAEQEDLVSIRAKDVEQRQLILTASQARVVMYSSIIFLPLVVLALGVAIWWNRR